MISKGNQPNAAQKRWMDEVAKVGPIVNGSGRLELHHVVGVTAKHNKVAIGHYWLLPLPSELHALTGTPEFDERVFGFVLGGRFDAEKLLFQNLLKKIPRWADHLEPSVYNSILGYQR